MNTNIEVLRELDELVEAARLLGVTQAKKGFGCYTDEDHRFERAMYESIDKHRAALEAVLEDATSKATSPAHMLLDAIEQEIRLLAERDRLAAENEALAKDAARYRWLRDPCSGAERVIFYCRGDYGRGLMTSTMLDAAIDEAMEKEDR